MADSSYQDSREVPIDIAPSADRQVTRRNFLRKMVIGAGAALGLTAFGPKVGIGTVEAATLPQPEMKSESSADTPDEFLIRNQAFIEKEPDKALALKDPIFKPEDRQRLLKDTYTDEELAAWGIRIIGDLNVRLRKSLLREDHPGMEPTTFQRVLRYAQQRSELQPVNPGAERGGLPLYSSNGFKIIKPGFKINVIQVKSPTLDLDKDSLVPEEFREEFRRVMEVFTKSGKPVVSGFCQAHTLTWPGNHDYDLKNQRTGNIFTGRDATHYEFNVCVADSGPFRPRPDQSHPGYNQLSPTQQYSIDQLRDPAFWEAMGKQYADIWPSYSHLMTHELRHVAARLYNDRNDEIAVDTDAIRDMIQARRQYEKHGDDSLYPLVVNLAEAVIIGQPEDQTIAA